MLASRPFRGGPLEVEPGTKAAARPGQCDHTGPRGGGGLDGRTDGHIDGDGEGILRLRPVEGNPPDGGFVTDEDFG